MVEFLPWQGETTLFQSKKELQEVWQTQKNTKGIQIFMSLKSSISIECELALYLEWC
jgi:hypothetical protein